MEPSQSPTAVAGKPALSDDERQRLLRQLAERLVAPDGLDRETLGRIEQLTDQPT